MKNLVLKSSIAALALMAMGAANAQIVSEGRVNFTGNIRHVTCSLKADSQNMTVSLGYIAPTAFTSIGTTAGEKPFQINLERCTIGNVPGTTTTYPANATVRFTGSNINPTTGRLNLAGAGSATGVQIRLKNAQGNEMRLNQPNAGAGGGTQNATSITIADGDNSLNFSAEYVSTAASVGAGNGNSSVEFEMIYF